MPTLLHRTRVDGGRNTDTVRTVVASDVNGDNHYYNNVGQRYIPKTTLEEYYNIYY
jgi:hypothetical protein